jgi:hypothetical protein
MSQNADGWKAVKKVLDGLLAHDLLSKSEQSQIEQLRFSIWLEQMLGWDYSENIAFQGESPLLAVTFQKVLLTACDSFVISVEARSVEGRSMCSFVEDKEVWHLQTESVYTDIPEASILFSNVFPKEDKQESANTRENWRCMVALSRAIGYLA